MEPQMVKMVSITIDKLQKNKPCFDVKQGLLLYHGFRHCCHLLLHFTPTLGKAGVGLLIVPDAAVTEGLGFSIHTIFSIV